MSNGPPPDETCSPPGGHPTPTPGPTTDALPAWVLHGLPEYQVVRELGRGGMGAVHLARNRLTGRLEALKVVARTDAADRLLREVRAAAALAHPNVVAAYSARLVGGVLVFAMEYVDGVDLYRLVRDGGPLPVAEACEYARQAALGLDHAHRRGMVHRDVKPHNLIRARDGTVKVLDFGLVRAVSDEPAEQGLTPDWEAVGTPSYMAPELATDPRRADGRADVYGLACTLYYLLTGRPPFEGVTPYEVVEKHRDREPTPLDRACPGVSAALASVVARMLAKDPAGRYPTAADAAAALAPFADPGATPLPAPKTGRGRALTLGAIAAGAGVVGLVVLLALGPNRPEPPANGASAPEPIALFNGRDLSGWVVDGGGPDEWWVEDGILVTAATRNGPKTWLLTERDVGDFILRFEYQLNRGANSGLAFRAVPGERPVLRPGGPPTPAPYHLQVELTDDAAPRWAKLPTGQVHGGASTDGPALKPVRPARLNPTGEWNAAEVVLRGRSLRVTINGQPVQEADLTVLAGSGSRYPGLARSAGRVGFQQHTGTAKFRDIRLQELPPGAGE
jgi:predicted Ser/Thr protein kinase